MDNPLVQPDPGLFVWTILTEQAAYRERLEAAVRRRAQSRQEAVEDRIVERRRVDRPHIANDVRHHLADLLLHPG